MSRGGNFLLNIAPDPQGRWDSIAYQRLDEIGAWIQTNGQAIYNSKPLAPYQINDGNNGSWVFTQVDKSTYAIWIPGSKPTTAVTLDLAAAFPLNKFSKVKALNPGNYCSIKKDYLQIGLGTNKLNTPQVFKLQ